jgi:hypothetical protein
MPENDQPLLSRTGIVSPIGTLIADLKTKVDPDTEQAFRRICAESGTDVAGALRNYVCKVVHGKTFDELVIQAAQRRRLSLALEGPNGALIPETAMAG